MDGLILAAGMGTRLRNAAQDAPQLGLEAGQEFGAEGQASANPQGCKPLTKLHGLSLLEIAVRQLARVGVTRVHIATGYQAQLIEAKLPAIAERTGIELISKRVGDYRQPNGHSVIAGAQGLSGDFLLVMADHILASQVLEKLVARAKAIMGPVPAPNSAPAPTSANKESQPSRPAVVLAVDYRLSSPLIDPEDATYVACSKDGLIGQIGKHIQTFDAVDCGAFYASSELVRAIGEAIDTGQPGSLSDGMQRLADQGLAQTCDIGDSWWMDVDDARALELAKAQMREYLPELAADVAGEMTGESGSLGRMGAGREDMRSIAEGEQ